MEAPSSPDISKSLIDDFGGLDLHLNDDFFNLENSKEEDIFNISPSSGPLLSNINIKQEFPSNHDMVKVEHNESKTKKKRTSNKDIKDSKAKDRQQPKKSRGIQKEPKKPVDPKYHKRLQANKKSAQASRERRKYLKVELETLVGNYQQENKTLQRTITELETENQVLKKEFVTLQKIIMENPLLSKFFSKEGKFPELETTNSTITSISAIQMMILLYCFRQQLMPNSLHFHVEHQVPTVVV